MAVIERGGGALSLTFELRIIVFLQSPVGNLSQPTTKYDNLSNRMT